MDFMDFDGDIGSDFEEEGPDSTTGNESNMNREAKTQWASIFKREAVLEREKNARELDSRELVACLPDGGHEGIVSTSEIPMPYSEVFSEYPYFNVVQSRTFHDIMNTNNSIAVCAPTGTGKTALFEMAILKAVIDHDSIKTGRAFSDKIIYMCPLKALCFERFNDWKPKFAPLDLEVCEVTGDSNLEEQARAHRSHIIITTPEKWDAVTRKWKGNNKSIMDQTRLICIDEVHLLSEVGRGACLEAIVSRVKTAKITGNEPSNSLKSFRFIAVSATAPNIDDVAEWLSLNQRLPGRHFKIGNDQRPVKVTMHVIGITYPGNPHAFDRFLNCKIPEAIALYGEEKPTLVFCMTRKSCEEGARELAKVRPHIYDHNLRQVLCDRASQLAPQTKMREMFEKGVAYHHAGLERKDRDIIETSFGEGILSALFSTSTLAMGINLPAHLVILKGTHKWATGGAEELCETDILQMTGRAGRPQFDSSAAAVIFCNKKDEEKIKRLVCGEKTLESSLHKNLPEHLNAEVVLGTVGNVSDALVWLKSTFFYIRCLKNKPYYGLDRFAGDQVIENHLKNLCLRELNGLVKYKMIRMEEESVSATEVGRLMAILYISFETMKEFVNIKAKTPLKDLLFLVSKAKETIGETTLRPEDKKLLFAFHDPKSKLTVQKVRFQRKEKIKAVEDKAFTLFQTEFGCFHEQSEFNSKYSREIGRLLRVGTRIAKCLLDYVCLKDIRDEKGFQTVRNAIQLAKIFRRGIWENSNFVSKQFDGVGPKLSSDLVKGGFTSFQEIEKAHPSTLEGLCGKRAPWGTGIIQQAKSLPKYGLLVKQVIEGPNIVKITLQLFLLNRTFLRENSETETAKESKRKKSTFPSHTILLVGNTDDRILFFKQFPDSELISKNTDIFEIEVPKPENSPQNKIFVGVFNDSWIGIDLQKLEYEVTFTYFTATVSRILNPKNSVSWDINALEVNQQNHLNETSTAATSSEKTLPLKPFETNDKTCDHRCKNKETCKHSCCKTATSLFKHPFKLTPSKRRPIQSPEEKAQVTSMSAAISAASASAAATVKRIVEQYETSQYTIKQEATQSVPEKADDIRKENDSHDNSWKVPFNPPPQGVQASSSSSWVPSSFPRNAVPTPVSFPSQRQVSSSTFMKDYQPSNKVFKVDKGMGDGATDGENDTWKEVDDVNPWIRKPIPATQPHPRQEYSIPRVKNPFQDYQAPSFQGRGDQDHDDDPWNMEEDVNPWIRKPIPASQPHPRKESIPRVRFQTPLHHERGRERDEDPWKMEEEVNPYMRYSAQTPPRTQPQSRQRQRKGASVSIDVTKRLLEAKKLSHQSI